MAKNLFIDNVNVTMNFNSDIRSYRITLHVPGGTCCYCHNGLNMLPPMSPNGRVQGTCPKCECAVEYVTMVLSRRLAEFFDVRAGAIDGYRLLEGGVMHVCLPVIHPEFDNLVQYIDPSITLGEIEKRRFGEQEPNEEYFEYASYCKDVVRNTYPGFFYKGDDKENALTTPGSSRIEIEKVCDPGPLKPWSCAIDTMRQMAIMGCEDGTVVFWDLTTGEKLKSEKGHNNKVRSIAFSLSHYDHQAITTGDDLQMILWDLNDYSVLKKYSNTSVTHQKVIGGPMIGYAITGDLWGKIDIWNLKTGEVEGSLGFPEMPRMKCAVTSLKYTIGNYGHYIIYGGDFKGIAFYDISSNMIGVMSGVHNDVLWAISLSPDQKMMATGSRDQRIGIWDFPNKQLIRFLQGHLDQVLDVQFSPYGDRLVSAGADNCVRIWDVKTGNQIQMIKGLDGPVRNAVFSENGVDVWFFVVEKGIYRWTINPKKE